jgi:hypothetical protein
MGLNVSFQQSLVTMLFILLSLAKTPIENESEGGNREIGGRGKANNHDPSFPIPQPSLLFFFFFSFNSLIFLSHSHLCLIQVLHLQCFTKFTNLR